MQQNKRNNMNKTKTLGQVLTPPHIVRAILDACGYVGSAILCRSVMEPSCGDGAFLVEIVRRYIDATKEVGMPPEQTAAELSQYIFGIEIDEEMWRKCVMRLDKVVAETLGSVRVQWQILHGNTLHLYKNYSHTFDWIVGNPPYVRIHNLPEDTRRFIKQHFRFAIGTTDMYPVFFEVSFTMLKPDGKLGFITPNSFLYNTSYHRFRTFLQQQGSLKTLCDLKAEKVFVGFSTYTAITVIDLAQKNAKCFDYTEYDEGSLKTVNRIPFATLNNRRWALSEPENSRFLQQLSEGKNARLGDFFDIQYGFATLRDKIFIGRATDRGDGTADFNGAVIETALLRPIVKGSRYKGNLKDEAEQIIFPYYKNTAGRQIPYTEDELAKHFPLGYAYLAAHKEELLKRDLDNKTAWHEFGRSQGIQNADKEKTVLSTLVYDQVRFFRLPEKVCVYSGILITDKFGHGNQQLLIDTLSSSDFLRYVRLTGKDFSGGYKSVSTKQIKEFPVNAPVVQNALF